MAFDKKRFGDILNSTKNKLTESMKNDVKDLRNDEFKTQMNRERQKAENKQLWDEYKRTGEKIDVPEFDAKVIDLPENDVNEKEIKIAPQNTKGISSFIPKQESPEWELENQAGNGLSQSEPKTPTGVSTYLDNRQNEEMELENLAGNGMETPPEKPAPVNISSTLPKQTDEEWDLEDMAGNGQREDLSEPYTEDTFIPEPEFKGEPSEMEEPDVIPEPDEAEEEVNSVTDEEVENTPSPEEEEQSHDPTIVDKTLNEEEGKQEEEPPEEEEEGDEDEEKKSKKEKDKTTKGDGPINDDSDLVKRGSGVSINDIVDRSAIPHYDYLSFFR